MSHDITLKKTIFVQFLSFFLSTIKYYFRDKFDKETSLDFSCDIFMMILKFKKKDKEEEGKMKHET